MYEFGIGRLRDEFGLDPVEYPTTRSAEATPAERARDVEAAFADTSVRAVIATIGGEDEIKVLRHLDPLVIQANPKPFLGYSDNTNLHLFLWNLGLVSYYGGSLMVELGRRGEIHPYTRHGLERALFGRGPAEVVGASESTDESADWAGFDESDPPPILSAAEPLSWHGREVFVTGPGWGGCLEIVDFHLRAGRHIAEPEVYRGGILFLETSEELPSASYVYRVLMGMGERGMLQMFAAVLWGRPKAWSLEQPSAPDWKTSYVREQQDAVLKAVEEYSPGTPVVFGLDFGHTDPQTTLPSGGEISIDSVRRRIEAVY